MSHETDFILTSGAARLLNCTPDGVRYLERTGRLCAVRVDGVRLFRRADVVRLRCERQQERQRRAGLTNGPCDLTTGTRRGPHAGD